VAREGDGPRCACFGEPGECQREIMEIRESRDTACRFADCRDREAWYLMRF